VRSSLSLGPEGTLEFDDVFSGTSALSMAASSVATPLATLLPNPFKSVSAESLTVHIDATEEERYTTIERTWLDTVRPVAGGTYRVHVQLRDYRGGTRVVDLPITMPAQSAGPLTLLVSDGPALQAFERRELRPSDVSSWEELLLRTRETRRGNRLYVRLLADRPGTVLGGDVMPSLPASVQSAVQSDPTSSRASVSKAVVGSWEQRLDRLVRGSRELSITLDPAR
jgi:hypothetical protein